MIGCISIDILLDQSVLTSKTNSGLIRAYPGDSLKMMMVVITGVNIECTVEYTGMQSYIGRMVRIVYDKCLSIYTSTNVTAYDSLIARVTWLLLIIALVFLLLVIIICGSTALLKNANRNAVITLITVYFLLATNVMLISLQTLLLLIAGMHAYFYRLYNIYYLYVL